MSQSQIQNAPLDSDMAHLDNLKGGRTFMAAISPWFFTVRLNPLGVHSLAELVFSIMVLTPGTRM